jgi:hypothetical protein
MVQVLVRTTGGALAGAAVGSAQLVCSGVVEQCSGMVELTSHCCSGMVERPSTSGRVV